jgi:protein O-GlcNAc transferase
VIPPHTRRHYSENVIYLPHSYYPNSYRFNEQSALAAGGGASRAQLGLPETGFVFCCFNSPYKILPTTFTAWMRILNSVEGSVLWLFADNPVTARNLRSEAEKRGVSGARIVVASPLPLAQHLPRHRAADLFLDTHPCGAHTTATDALWTGLPVLTRCGESLASRVPASLLAALGLPELVTSSAEEYEALAIALATDPQSLSALRSRLEAGRLTMPLFDTRLLARHLEHGYAQIYRRYHSGLPPEDVRVPAEVPSSEVPAAPVQGPSG